MFTMPVEGGAGTDQEWQEEAGPAGLDDAAAHGRRRVGRESQATQVCKGRQD